MLTAVTPYIRTQLERQIQPKAVLHYENERLPLSSMAGPLGDPISQLPGEPKAFLKKRKVTLAFDLNIIQSQLLRLYFFKCMPMFIL